MYHCKNQTLRTLYKTFILERPSFPKFFERQLRFIASGIILQNCFAVKRCRQFLLTVCCVRHAFQVLRCVNNGSGQTACRLFSRLYLIVAKVVAVQISPFKPTFVITETQFTRGVPSRVLMLVCWKFWYGVPFLRHCVQFGAIQLHKQRFCCLGTAIFRCCGAKRSNQALAICFAVFCQVAEQKLIRCQFCLSKLPCFTVEPRQRYKMHVI